MDTQTPFSVFKKNPSPFYYVKFKNELTGGYSNPISTKEKDYSRAIKKAWEFYSTKNSKVESLKLNDVIRSMDINKQSVENLMEIFYRQGYIKNYIITDSSQDVDALEFLYDFWNKEKSEYLKEKKRKGHEVHSKHTENSITNINKYWLNTLKGLSLGEITRATIQKEFSYLDTLELNGNTKNHIMRSVLTPLKWAYTQELLIKDVTTGWSFYTCSYKPRNILTKEIAMALFNHQWHDQRMKLANILAMCTGMRLGEIRALTMADIGINCIYVNHSWSDTDGLKTTKNGEARTEEVIFSELIYNLSELGKMNPHNSENSFIFWGTLPDKPLESKCFISALRSELVKIGMTKKESSQYTFHSWRHFYTSNMKDRISDKLLQSQTGHKTLEILNHYGSHTVDGDKLKIQQAQYDCFSDIFNTPKLIENNN